jgi:NAD(P)-dependent dehydrogenase (short-subunit alcohol dehydrogenase family)
MQDKICIITGANSGIGFYTALALARKGATIVMVCRNAEKAETAKQEIMDKTQNKNIAIFLADFSSLEESKRVGKEVAAKYPKIDILINNAGFIAKGYREVTADGLEKTFAVNHMGYFIFTHFLLDAVKAAPQGRIISVSSEAHRFVSNVDLTNLQLTRGYTSFKAYGISKLCNIWFTRELARRLKDTNVTVNCVHPGAVATNFGTDSGPFFETLLKLGKMFLLTPQQGAETSIFLASNPEVSKVTGEYFSKSQIKKISRDARDDAKAKKLWDMSLEIAGL